MIISRRLSSKIKAWWATKYSNRFFGKNAKEKQIIIDDISVLENLKNFEEWSVVAYSKSISHI